MNEFKDITFEELEFINGGSTWSPSLGGLDFLTGFINGIKDGVNAGLNN